MIEELKFNVPEAKALDVVEVVLLDEEQISHLPLYDVVRRNNLKGWNLSLVIDDVRRFYPVGKNLGRIIVVRNEEGVSIRWNGLKEQADEFLNDWGGRLMNGLRDIVTASSENNPVIPESNIVVQFKTLEDSVSHRPRSLGNLLV